MYPDGKAYLAEKREEGECMKNLSKKELIEQIESARNTLNTSIDKGEDYDQIYQYSVALDQLIEQYITAGF